MIHEIVFVIIWTHYFNLWSLLQS